MLSLFCRFGDYSIFESNPDALCYAHFILKIKLSNVEEITYITLLWNLVSFFIIFWKFIKDKNAQVYSSTQIIEIYRVSQLKGYKHSFFLHVKTIYVLQTFFLPLLEKTP